MAKLYRGNPHWLYQQMKRNWIKKYGSASDLMAYSKFREKIDQGTELMFAGDSYKGTKEITTTGTFYDTSSIQR